eukprot:900527-Rhodomonas_salina.1
MELLPDLREDVACTIRNFCQHRNFCHRNFCRVRLYIRTGTFVCGVRRVGKVTILSILANRRPSAL